MAHHWIVVCIVQIKHDRILRMFFEIILIAGVVFWHDRTYQKFSVLIAKADLIHLKGDHCNLIIRYVVAGELMLLDDQVEVGAIG